MPRHDSCLWRNLNDNFGKAGTKPATNYRIPRRKPLSKLGSTYHYLFLARNIYDKMRIKEGCHMLKTTEKTTNKHKRLPLWFWEFWGFQNRSSFRIRKIHENPWRPDIAAPEYPHLAKLQPPLGWPCTPWMPFTQVNCRKQNFHPPKKLTAKVPEKLGRNQQRKGN